MNILSFTEPGGHPENEDAYRVARHPHAPDLVLVALADGQGGQTGGGRAAARAVDAVIKAAGRLPPDRLCGHPPAWREILRRADEAVLADPDAGFTTLVGFAADGAAVTGASCGDSAVLLTHGGAGGVLTDHQFKNPPVGSGDATFVPFTAVPAAGWAVVAMTDGVWKYVGWEAVLAAAGGLRGRPLIDALAARARLPGSGRFPDDFTLVVLDAGG